MIQASARLRRVALAVAMLAPTAGSGARAAPAPQAGVASLRDLPTPLPLPFDPGADAHAQVATAQARAKASGKLVLIDLGGNWCADCRLLEAVMRLPAVAAFVGAHYEVVRIDVGRLDRNLDIPARWGLRRLWGVPALLVIDGHGRLVDARSELALVDAGGMKPQAIADWLARWTP